MASRADFYDVAVIGGGPAGSAAAITLADAGLSVALIERSVYADARIGETLPPRARPLLERLGCAGITDGVAVAAPGIVSVWGSASPYSTDFLLNPYGNGWHLDRARFDRELAACARARGADLLEGSSATAVVEDTHGWRVTVCSAGGEQEIACRAIVDASGRRPSRVKQRAGRRETHDRLIGLAAFQDAPASDDARTLIEAARDGWWYSSALPDGRHVVVYMTDGDLLGDARRDTRGLLADRLRMAPFTHSRCGDIRADSVVLKFPAMTSSRARVCGSTWALVGDAAMTWDPLSGQGICKALESGVKAGDAIAAAFRGEASGLELYERWCDRVLDEYLTSRTSYYAAEQRWPDAPFWRRRHIASRRAA